MRLSVFSEWSPYTAQKPEVLLIGDLWWELQIPCQHLAVWWSDLYRLRPVRFVSYGWLRKWFTVKPCGIGIRSDRKETVLQKGEDSPEGENTRLITSGKSFRIPQDTRGYGDQETKRTQDWKHFNRERIVTSAIALAKPAKKQIRVMFVCCYCDIYSRHYLRQ